MATRSTIGVYNSEDNSVQAIYCHYDGYPEYTGKLLIQHYNSRELVDRLLELGDISSLETTLADTFESSYAYRGEDVPALKFSTRHDWLNYYANAWCEYAYLYVDGGWEVYEGLNTPARYSTCVSSALVGAR